MSSKEELVLGAVRQSHASKKQSVLQKLFAVWFDAFVYNQIWEDPRVDIEALSIDRASRILTISSGGCNALNYLIESPGAVTAIDLNRHHIYLLNLKVAALKYLPGHEEFFAFFGVGKDDRSVEWYDRFLAQHLDAETRRFWESNSLIGRMTHSRRIDFFRKSGIYQHSRNGYFLRFFHRFSHILGCRPEELLLSRDQEDQAVRYERYIEPFFESRLIGMIGKMPVTLFGLGIPPQQYQELTKDLADGGSILDIYRERTRKLAVEYPIDENYFAWQAFGLKYDTEERTAVPEYLKKSNFEQLRSNISGINTKIGSIVDEISLSPEGSYNRFVLLDAQDWMDAAALNELWQAIADKAEPGSRIIFRTAGKNSPLETQLEPGTRDRFHYESDLSRSLFEGDRASIYGGFHLYLLK